MILRVFFFELKKKDILRCKYLYLFFIFSISRLGFSSFDQLMLNDEPQGELISSTTKTFFWTVYL